MSGGGEVRVLLQEPGQESPRMPAWKREILERRKAKGGGSGGAAGETSPSSAGPQRTNGELTGNVNGNSGSSSSVPQGDSGPTGGGGSGRNYTITTANQHFGNNKEPPATSEERTSSREDIRHESLVLQESLGPLEENPFIKLEKERRRRHDRENAARPVQHILELYGSVPGIRTIRADNIIIIESDPDYFPEAGGLNSGSKWQQNGVSSYSSLNDLLDRRGSAVTEIRAKEVVIYDTTLSKSEENLSTLGRPDHELPSYETGEGQGRVSRMLQKFDSNYGKLQKKSHSTENLLDLDCSASSSGRPSRFWSKPQPDLVPKPRPGPSSVSSQPTSPVFLSPWSSKPKPQPSVSSSEPPQSVSSYRQRFDGPSETPHRDELDRGQTKPSVRERDREDVVEGPTKPKVPSSVETLRSHTQSPSNSLSSKVSRSSSDFEIRPSPKPDIARIPDEDTQARALANLRLQSRNSFTVIPKRRPVASPATVTPPPTSPVKSSFPSHRAAEVPTPGGVPTPHSPKPTLTTTSKRSEEKVQEKDVERWARPSKPEPSPVTTSPTNSPSSERLSPTPTPTPVPSSPPSLSSPTSVPTSPSFSPLPSESPTPSQVPIKPPADHLPVTNIDDIEVEPSQRLPVPSPAAQRKKGNTFTVVPRRRAGESESAPQPGSPEPPQEASSVGSTPPQAPYSHLGSLLKKRYPAVEEIEVIGGYLSLDKSCLIKTGSTGKKLQISFNESSLRSTYEYPSESSVWDSGDEDEEEKPDGPMSDEQPSMVGRIHIPRAGFPNSPTHTNNGNDLSSYVPKHSVDFSAWQEHKHEDIVYQEETTSQPTQMTEEVMLTPADSSSLSDYSSEPALYF